jgi:protocatechuate 4,5-dioxygenase alpha chain
MAAAGRAPSVEQVRDDRVRDDYVFDAEASRRGYALNRLLMSLQDAGARARFGADEAAYCDAFGLDPQHRAAVLGRDWVGLFEAGANIFYVYKLALVDGVSIQYLGGLFAGTSEEQFRAALMTQAQTHG